MSSDEYGYENGQVVPVECENEHVEAVREFLDADSELTPEEERLMKGIAYATCADILRRAFMFLMAGKDQSKRIDILASAFGVSAIAGRTNTELAEKHGVSKQDWQQSIERVVAELGLKRVVLRTSKKKTENYAKSNYRKPASAWR